MLIDGDKLAMWLRMHSGLDTTTILEMLPRFEVTAASAAPQTPIKKISVEPKQLVHRNDPGTSWEAAMLQLSEKRQRVYRAIYLVLTHFGPQTDHEVHQILKNRNFPHTWSGVVTRRGELVKAGWVRATDQKRLTENGSPATVWEAVPEA